MSDQDFRVVPSVPPRSKKEQRVKDKVGLAIPFLFANLGEWCLLFSQPAPAKMSHSANQHGCHFRRSLEIALAISLAYNAGSYDVESKRHIAIDEVTGERYTGVWFRVSYNSYADYANGTHKYHSIGSLVDMWGLEAAIKACDDADNLSSSYPS